MVCDRLRLHHRGDLSGTRSGVGVRNEPDARTSQPRLRWCLRTSAAPGAGGRVVGGERGRRVGLSSSLCTRTEAPPSVGTEHVGPKPGCSSHSGAHYSRGAVTRAPPSRQGHAVTPDAHLGKHGAARGRCAQPPPPAVPLISIVRLGPQPNIYSSLLIAANLPFERIRLPTVPPLRADNHITGFPSSSNLIKGNICLPKMRRACLAPPLKQGVLCSPQSARGSQLLTPVHPARGTAFQGGKFNGKRAKDFKKSFLDMLIASLG